MHPTTNNADELRAYIARMKSRLLNFTIEADIQELLQEQVKLEKICGKQKQVVEDAKEEAPKNARLIRRQQEALVDKKSAHELKEQQKNRRERLEKLEQLDAPQVIIENEKRMLWEVTASVEGLVVCHAEKQQLVTHAMQELKHAAAKLATQRELYRLEKKKVQQAITTAEQSLRDLTWSATTENNPISKTTGSSIQNGHRPVLSKRRRKRLHPPETFSSKPTNTCGKL